jgi:uncharacterized protein YneF (UPF0154 family)
MTILETIVHVVGLSLAVIVIGGYIGHKYIKSKYKKK